MKKRIEKWDFKAIFRKLSVKQEAELGLGLIRYIQKGEQLESDDPVVMDWFKRIVAEDLFEEVDDGTE